MGKILTPGADQSSFRGFKNESAWGPERNRRGRGGVGGDPYSALLQSIGVVEYWTFDDSTRSEDPTPGFLGVISGSLLQDVGTGFTSVAALVGQAVRYTNIATHHMWMAAANLIGGDFTIIAWQRRTGNINNNNPLVATRDGTVNGAMVGNQASGGNDIGWSLDKTSSAGFNLLPGYVPLLDEWEMVVVRFVRSTALLEADVLRVGVGSVLSTSGTSTILPDIGSDDFAVNDFATLTESGTDNRDVSDVSIDTSRYTNAQIAQLAGIRGASA